MSSTIPPSDNPHGLDANLASFPLPQVEAVLNDGTISALNAANLINHLPEAQAAGVQTSKTSVRRYRSAHGIEAEAKRSKVPELDELADPQTPGAVSPKPVQPKSSWTPGYELEDGQGEIRTQARVVRPGEILADPDELEILAEFGLSAETWSVTNMRRSRWQQRTADGEETWLEAARVNVRKRDAHAANLDPAAMEAVLHAYPLRRARKKPAKGSLVVGWGDAQLGKGTSAADDPGTPLIVKRVAACVSEVEQRIVDEFGGDLANLVLVLCGDLIEGQVSQGSSLPNDIPVPEQVRVCRRLVCHMVATLAGYADNVHVVVVPGNHDVPRRDQVVPARSSWAVEAVSSAQDALELTGNYSNVRWVYPDGSEDVSAAVEVEGVIIGAVHGNQYSSPDRLRQWWSGQALADVPAASAQILLTGHYHHLRVESISKTKTWIQVPATDNGSPWFKNKRGSDAPAGMISFRLTPGLRPYWTALVLHEGTHVQA